MKSEFQNPKLEGMRNGESRNLESPHPTARPEAGSRLDARRF
jgi:hypothetical protein